jgi:16S rRNA U516 pseudouridylate synthase RsuA-like enzyme
MIRKFTLPNQKSSKIYQVSLDKNLKYEDLEKISKGLVLDGHRVFVEEVSYIDNEPKSEIGLKLRSSNVKVVRAIFENFDYNVLFSECIRYNNEELILKLNNIEKYCTMLEGQKKLNLYKWPKLILLVDYFFPHEKWNQKHNALDDAQYCFKCYCKLENM